MQPFSAFFALNQPAPADVNLDGEHLTIDEVVAVAAGAPGAPGVQLAPAAEARVQRAADAVQTLVQRGTVAYGITTGFGAFKDRVIAPEQVAQLQRNIVMSHAVGVGEPYDRATTRAIMLIRANTLARGVSGIRPATLKLLIEMINRGVLPLIPQKGSLGASGDLAPLAHMALVMIGKGEALLEAGGKLHRLPGAVALREVGLEPAELAAKEGLALTNGTAVMCALGTLEAQRARLLSRVADITGCLSLEALHGTPLAFDARIHALRPFPRQQNCAAYLRALLAGSEFTRHDDPANVQDAYTLRCIPQVHGAVRDAIAYARWAMEIELNAVTDNPIIFITEPEAGAGGAAGEAQGGAVGEAQIEVISGGNFHGEPLAIAFDYLGIAMAELGNISERRLMRLTDEASNAHVLPAFLTRQGGLNSGFMILQYTSAALAAENKVLAHPASVDTIPTSANVEDHVSMGVTAALHMRQINENVERMLGLELMAAAQAVDFRKQALGPAAKLGAGTAPAYAMVRNVVPFIEEDTVLYGYIEAVRQMISSGALVRTVNRYVDDAWQVNGG